ncbi:lytic transglycosylase domain-containing protein [bacterium]|nr:lytic transglycosylase domain-containing protein [bacterium]
MKKPKQKLKWMKEVVLCLSCILLVFLGKDIQNLFEKMNRGNREREKIRKRIEKTENRHRTNQMFLRDVLEYRALYLCFEELIEPYEEKYSLKEIENCTRIIAMVDEKYGERGFDAPLILAWLEKESDGNPEAVSYAGAKGLTQLMDFNAKEIFVSLGYRGNKRNLAFNPVTNLSGGMHHVQTLMNFWMKKGIKNQTLILFYSLHSYKWGVNNTLQLFNSGKKAYRPAVEYVNWILNHREYWAERLEYYQKNINQYFKESPREKFNTNIHLESFQ